MKTAIDPAKYARSPVRAASEAASGMAMRLAMAYPVTAHPTWESEPPSSRWIRGSATLTMLPSTACITVASITPATASATCVRVRGSMAAAA